MTLAISIECENDALEAQEALDLAQRLADLVNHTPFHAQVYLKVDEIIGVPAD